MLFFTLDMAFLLLGIGYLTNASGEPQAQCIKAGGGFGILAAFLAWYNALAGIADSSNRSVACSITHCIFTSADIINLLSFFVVPVIHFPWSDKGREMRQKVNNDAARAEHV